ncbi:sensory neuron membrane protein 2 [Tribolium castaneum]|uniref:Sensory neuron membrane protein 2 n=1 Tax=Tribolium castaneum TaxID=7070 RepID=D6WGA2_TRICA|nr:PREDICTED: sensory neuron membrane protein 2 [Tribolium castaneum]EFA01368.1 Sensory neuron membrane protein 2-like Protein [Tribolium castaneum]|eukprot:XP_970008.1 PREDICTED: sensory neuron membrane protein 2 [Tribolium castaneum]
MGCSCCTIKVLLVCVVISVALLIVSLALAFKVFPDLLESEVNKAVRLEDGTKQYDRFVELPFPVDFKVYLFNVSNPQQVLDGTEKPKLEEIGPFVYKQYRKKTILGKNEEEDTISYTQKETFEFDAEASKPLTEESVVTVLNPALMSIYQLAEDLHLAGAADTCIKQTFENNQGKVFIEANVRKLLFDGFSFCKNTSPGICGLVNDLICAIAATKRNSDLVLPDYSLIFSYLNYKRKPDDGKYTVKRGLTNIEKLGHIVAWNDSLYTKFWGEGTTCSEVKGTDSTLYPPRVTTDSAFYIYSTDICRFVKINYKGEESYKGIDGYLFETSEDTLRSSAPEEDCYCSKLSRDMEGKKSCFLDGVIDMQTCFGVPVLFSFPHFLWADNKYLSAVEGLNPVEEKHKTYLVVEPNTGTPLKGMKRIQLNGVIRPIVGIKSMLQTKRALLPLLWIEEGVSLPQKYVDELKSSYFDKVQIVDGVRYALIVISAILVGAFGIIILRKRSHAKHHV